MPVLTMKETPRPTSTTTEQKLEEIRSRAYELYESRGREDGHDLEDWLQAEIDITATASAAA